MLDALMGRNRNLPPGAEVHEPTWEDEGVCRYNLVQYCPHDLFTNTKADLGACTRIHNDVLKVISFFLLLLPAPSCCCFLLLLLPAPSSCSSFLLLLPAPISCSFLLPDLVYTGGVHGDT